MALVDYLFFLFIFYLLYNRLIRPLRNGYRARERERNAGRPFFSQPKQPDPRIDRSRAKDAEFRDIK
jgi:hypothetical protein